MEEHQYKDVYVHAYGYKHLEWPDIVMHTSIYMDFID